MPKVVAPWIARLAVAACVAVTFHQFVLNDFASANHVNRYAIAQESVHGDYTGIQGEIYTGAPNPVPAGTLSNQHLWVVRLGTSCTANPAAGLSWIETGWTKYGSAAPKYVLIHKLPTWNCTYIQEAISGNPAPGSFHSYKLECPSCYAVNGNWFFYLDGLYRAGMVSGWDGEGNVTYLNAGGEVAGHYTGIAMLGGINNLKYRRAVWSSYNQTLADSCSFGYTLIWNGGSADDIFDWGYTGQAGDCPH